MFPDNLQEANYFQEHNLTTSPYVISLTTGNDNIRTSYHGIVDDQKNQEGNNTNVNSLRSSTNSLTSTLFHKNFHETRPLKKLKGDQHQVQEINENEFNLIMNESFTKISPAIIPIARKSSLFNYISKEDLNAIRGDRQPTPEKIRSGVIIDEILPDNQVSSDRRSFIRHHTTLEKDKKNILEELEAINNSNNILNVNLDQEKKYTINTNDMSIIKLPPNFTTDDADLKFFCDLVNEPTNLKGWKKVMEDKIVNIYKKTIPGSDAILLKTNAYIDGFLKDEVFDAISDVNLRKEWDTVFSEFKIVDSNEEEGWEILYSAIRSPSMWISDRDFVQKRKIWKNFPTPNCSLIHFKSAVSPKCPVYKKKVRAESIISGYTIQTTSIDPPKTHLTSITQTDIKGNIPAVLVNLVAQSAPKEWVNNLIKGCEKVRKIKEKMNSY